MKFSAISAPLREKKQIKSRQGAKHAKVFGVRTNRNTKFLAFLAPLREKKQIKSRQGAKHAKVIGVRTNRKTKFSAASAPLRENKNGFNLAEAQGTLRC
jgi:hypothetical protein